MGEVKGFVEVRLKLETVPNKTGIKHHEKGARFLGYELRTGAKGKRKKVKVAGKVVSKRTKTGAAIQLYVPADKTRTFVERNRYGSLKNKNDFWAEHRAALLNNSDFDIVTQYRTEVRGFAEYYKLAEKFLPRIGTGSLHCSNQHG